MLDSTRAELDNQDKVAMLPLKASLPQTQLEPNNQSNEIGNQRVPKNISGWEWLLGHWLGYRVFESFEDNAA